MKCKEKWTENNAWWCHSFEHVTKRPLHKLLSFFSNKMMQTEAVLYCGLLRKLEVEKCVSVPVKYWCTIITHHPNSLFSALSLSLLSFASSPPPHLFPAFCCCDCLSPCGPMPGHHWVAFLTPSQREKRGSEGGEKRRRTNGRNEGKQEPQQVSLYRV